LEQTELKSVVQKAIAMLSDDHKAIIILRDIRGFSYDEIARITGTTEGTVKSRLSRARAQLKNIIEKNFGFDGTYFNK
jgi:RNA polymerase sigma-70 factor (ECF subfamily)